MVAARDFELLANLDADAARWVLSLAAPVVLPAGAVLFDLGADADALFLIEHGRVSLTLPVKVEGREADLLVEEKTGGQLVGWSAVIPPHRFTLKAVARVETALLAIPREPLLAGFRAQPTLGYTLTRNIATIVGQRLQVFQAMWLRQMQRMVEPDAASAWGAQ